MDRKQARLVADCPHCGRRVTGLPRHAGKSVNCPGCKMRFDFQPLAAGDKGVEDTRRPDAGTPKSLLILGKMSGERRALTKLISESCPGLSIATKIAADHSHDGAVVMIDVNDFEEEDLTLRLQILEEAQVAKLVFFLAKGSTDDRGLINTVRYDVERQAIDCGFAADRFVIVAHEQHLQQALERIVDGLPFDDFDTVAPASKATASEVRSQDTTAATAGQPAQAAPSDTITLSELYERRRKEKSAKRIAKSATDEAGSDSGKGADFTDMIPALVLHVVFPALIVIGCVVLARAQPIEWYWSDMEKTAGLDRGYRQNLDLTDEIVFYGLAGLTAFVAIVALAVKLAPPLVGRSESKATIAYAIEQDVLHITSLAQPPQQDPVSIPLSRISQVLAARGDSNNEWLGNIVKYTIVVAITGGLALPIIMILGLRYHQRPATLTFFLLTGNKKEVTMDFPTNEELKQFVAFLKHEGRLNVEGSV